MNLLYKIVFFLSALCVLIVLDFNFYNPVDLSFLFLLSINSIFLFNYSPQPISIYRNIQLFFFFFLILAPYIQFKDSVIFWGNSTFSQSDYLFCNILLIFLFIFYSLCYHYFRVNNIRFNSFSKNICTRKFNDINFFKLFLLYFISAICFFITFSNNGFSILSLLFRGGEYSQSSPSLSGTAWLLSQYLIRPLPLIIFLSYYLIKQKMDFHFIIFCLIGVITAFPLGMARFSVAALYIPLVIILIPILQRKFNFTITIIFSLLFLFPFLIPLDGIPPILILGLEWILKCLRKDILIPIKVFFLS